MQEQRPRPKHRPAEGLEASRKVGWALFYQERDRADGLATMSHRQRERIDLLLEALLELVDAVLTARNVDAFAFAYHIQGLIDRFQAEEAQ